MKTRLEEVVEHLAALIELAGLDKSESATEQFAEILADAAAKAIEATNESHEEGLCLDCRWTIAETILGISTVALWPEPRAEANYADDVKTPILCGNCQREGYVHFRQEDIDDLAPVTYECVGGRCDPTAQSEQTTLSREEMRRRHRLRGTLRKRGHRRRSA